MRLIMKRKQKPISRQVKIRSEKEEKDMDDYLLKQIDEFREKAEQLQELINTKETKVRELQLLVDERESKASKLKLVLDERQKEADSLVGNVEEQVDGLLKKIEEQQNANKAEIKQVLGDVTTGLNTVKTDVSEKVHTENVKCYRNIQSLFDEFSENQKEVEIADESMQKIKNPLGAVIGLLIVNLGATIAILLNLFGVLNF